MSHDPQWISRTRQEWTYHVRAVKQLMDECGPVNTDVENLIDQYVFKPAELPVGNKAETDNLIDEVVDGYIITSRKRLSAVKNAWCFLYDGDSIFLVWVGPNSETGLVYGDAIRYRKNLPSSNGYDVTWVWPIREGYLPIPPKTLIEGVS